LLIIVAGVFDFAKSCRWKEKYVQNGKRDWASVSPGMSSNWAIAVRFLQTQNVGAAARLDGHDASEDVEVTCVRFDNDGLKLAAGTSEGHTLTYDMRSSRPISVKDHRNGKLMLDEIFEGLGGLFEQAHLGQGSPQW
jgi:WD40 repeat protein